MTSLIELDGPGEPLLCLPGGPLRDPRYLGDLGGLAAHRRLVLLPLPHRRVDQLVDDVEAVRERLGLEQVDVLAHSAAGNLGLLYAAAHPDRVRRLALITPGTRVVGIEESEENFRAALALRTGEPWYPEAMAAVERWFAGEETPEAELAAAPFFYARWDETIAAHAAGEKDQMPAGAEAIYYADGWPDPETTRAALGKLAAPVLVLAGTVDPGLNLATAERLAALMPNATATAQRGAGHFPWLDDPAAFTGIVGRFVTG